MGPPIAACYRPSGRPFVRGEGCHLFDDEGRAFLDLGAGVAVSSLGHGHPALLRALHEQADRLLHVSNLYVADSVATAAAAITRATGTDRVFLTNSGAEAIEAAIKLARRWSQVVREEPRFRVVCAERSFHGRTFGALSATGQPKYHEGFEPLVPGFSHVPYGDVDALAAAAGDETAAILLEPLQGEGGVRLAPPGYLQAARDIADQRGCLLIFDEIQTGVGRTGPFLASSHDGVRADVVTLAKGIAGGLPLGATCYPEALAEALTPGSHASTFGGNPLCCAAASAVLSIVDTPAFADDVLRRGQILHEALRQRLDTAPARAGVVEVRGRGLMWGLELDRSARPVVTELFERGVLATVAGERVLRLSPPLVISDEDLIAGAGLVVDALIDTLPTSP